MSGVDELPPMLFRISVLLGYHVHCRLASTGVCADFLGSEPTGLALQCASLSRSR